MNVVYVVAAAENGVIGNAEGHLPWRIRSDMLRFKALTTGHPVIMGRTTFTSLGKPLPNRVNIVVTRNTSFHADGTLVAHSPEDALAVARDIDADTAFVIGGGEIYKALMPHCTRIYLTRVHARPDGIAFFEAPTDWETVESDYHEEDVANGDEVACTYLTLDRPPT